MAKSLKITWIRKFLDGDNKAKWKSVMGHKLRITNDITIFHCNASQKQVDNFVLSSFWKETISAWMNIKENQEISAHEILNEVLWNNKHIDLEKRKTFNRATLLEKGLTRILNIHDRGDKKLMSANEIATKFSLHPMKASTILASIPQQWKQKLMAEKPPCAHDNDNFVALGNM